MVDPLQISKKSNEILRGPLANTTESQWNPKREPLLLLSKVDWNPEGNTFANVKEIYWNPKEGILQLLQKSYNILKGPIANIEGSSEDCNVETHCKYERNPLNS